MALLMIKFAAGLMSQVTRVFIEKVCGRLNLEVRIMGGAWVQILIF